MRKYHDIMEEIRRILAANLEKFLNERGMTQEKFADCTSSTQAYVSQVMRGKRWPKPSTIKKFAKALEVKETDLFRENSWTEKLTADDADALFENAINALKLLQRFGIEIPDESKLKKQA